MTFLLTFCPLSDTDVQDYKLINCVFPVNRISSQCLSVRARYGRLRVQFNSFSAELFKVDYFMIKIGRLYCSCKSGLEYIYNYKANNADFR